MPTITQTIINRFTGDVQFIAEIECPLDTAPSLKLGMAVKVAIKEKADLRNANLRSADLRSADLRNANLRSANLRSADLYGADLYGADLYGADLYGADLRSADLRGADLYGADLYGADLYGADLRGADLRGADLGEGNWLVQGGVRSDGYAFHLQKLKDDKEPMVRAGCRFFTLPQARVHWTETRGGTRLGDETTIILDGLVALATARGLIAATLREAA